MYALDLDGIVDVLLDILEEFDVADDDSFSDYNGYIYGCYDTSNGTQFYIQSLPNTIHGPAAVLGIHENRYPTSMSGSHRYDEEEDWTEEELRDTVQQVLEEYGY